MPAHFLFYIYILYNFDNSMNCQRNFHWELETDAFFLYPATFGKWGPVGIFAVELKFSICASVFLLMEYLGGVERNISCAFKPIYRKNVSCF